MPERFYIHNPSYDNRFLDNFIKEMRGTDMKNFRVRDYEMTRAYCSYNCIPEPDVLTLTIDCPGNGIIKDKDIRDLIICINNFEGPETEYDTNTGTLTLLVSRRNGKTAFANALMTFYHDVVSGAYLAKKVIFNGPATIVLWEDGSKTVIKKTDDDPFDAEKAIALCYMKKFFGNGSEFKKQIKKWLPEEE